MSSQNESNTARAAVPEAGRLCRCQYCGHRFLLTPEKAAEGVVNLNCPQCGAPLTFDFSAGENGTAAPVRKRKALFSLAAAVLILAAVLLVLRAGKQPPKPLTGEELIESLSRYLTTDVEGVKSYAITADNFFEFYDTDTGDYKVVPGEGEDEPQIVPVLWLSYRLKPELEELIDLENSAVKVRVEGAYTLTLIESVNWESGEIRLSSTSSSDKIAGLQNILLANGETVKAANYSGVLKETAGGVQEIEVPLNYWSHGAWRFNMGVKGPISPLTRDSYMEGKTWLPQLAKAGLVSAQGTLLLESHEDMKYQVQKDGSAKIIQYTGTAETLRIPGALDGHRVSAIGEDAFAGCESLKSVSIPESVTVIGGWAFEQCPNLISVTIPDSVSTIECYAFDLCENLAGIRLPSGLASIEDGLFGQCLSLAEITIPDSVKSIGDYAFASCSLRSVNIPQGVVSIGAGAFQNCDLLEELVLPESVASIGSHAFAYCDGLKSFVVPDSVSSLGIGAFTECGSLTSVTLPAGLSTMGDWLFSQCGSLTEVVLPTGLTAIGRSTFSNCDSLEEITLPDGVVSIGEGAFSGCDKLAAVTLPDGLQVIGDEAFDHCGELKSIHIPDGVSSIGKSAFSFCESLQTVTVPDSVASIGKSAFLCCGGLTDVTLPRGLSAISDGLFKTCHGLCSLTIPDTVASIGDNAFASCSRLEVLDIPDSVSYIGFDAFEGCGRFGELNLIVGRDSYAEQYCVKNDLPFSYRGEAKS